MILSNSSVGLLDLNLNQSQKVLGSSSSPIFMKDYSVHYFGGNPREGQSLEEVKNLILEQIEKVKKGDFPDWMIEAIVNNMKLDDIKGYESNRRRAGAFMSSFVRDIPWDNYVNRTNRLSKITKQDVMDFAEKYYDNNYVVIYKRTGEDKNVVKVVKPEITPVDVNRQDQSEFLKTVSGMNSENIKPVFIDYKTDLTESKVKSDIPLIYKQNEENELFNLNFVVNYGDYNNKKLSLATAYFDYLGTSKYSPSQLKEEFYRLGCSYDISSDDEQTVISLSGLSGNFGKAMNLLQEILTDLKPNDDALSNLVQDVLKSRADAKLNKETILWDALFSYGKYGDNSPYKYILSESELKTVSSDELITIIKSLASYKQRILYYGPEKMGSISEQLNTIYKTPAGGFQNPPQPVIFEEKPITENTVMVANYDGMVQAEIIFLSKKELYNKEKIPFVTMYNEYFGGGMSGIVFQEIRESKALAYATFASYSSPIRKDRSHYNFAYIGTQSDKLPEAMLSMVELLNNMPESENTFESAKNNLIQKLNTERITKSAILSSYLAAEKLGLDYDIRKDIYDKAQNLTLADVKKFQEENVKGSNYTILVLGDKTKLDESTLAKYGKVKYVTLEEIFGY
jgi:predicted Zn-dependent peptidase